MFLFEYWNEVSPPTSELVAAYLGFERKKSTTGPSAIEEGILQNMGQARPFVCLPLEVQQWVRDNLGGRSGKVPMV